MFDVGETLLDDTREWKAWADWPGVPPHTMSALAGAVIAQGRDNADALRLIRPGLDAAAERRAREAAEPRQRGLWVGATGNQTAHAAELLRALALLVNAVATSGSGA